MTEPDAQVELPLLSSPRLDTLLVDSNETLTLLLKALAANNDPIAIDAERASGFRYGQRAYLIQIAVKDESIYLFDPTPEYATELLVELKSRINSTPWIIHAASQDLPCLNELGLYPTAIFDTELGGRILGLPKVSLGTMTADYLGLTLAKEHSAVDWSTRPLPAEWLNYAALDVDVLFDLWEAIAEELQSKDKYEIALAEFDHLTIPQLKSEKIERWRSVTGIHEIKDQRQLTIVKFLWEAREHLAKEKDVAPGRLIPDGSIIAAVKANPLSRSELASLRSFTGRASRTYIDEWWNALHKGQTAINLVELRPKATGLPNHRNWANKFPLANARFLWTRKLLSELSTAISIPIENLIAPDTVKAICFEPPELTEQSLTGFLDSRGVRKWQIALLLGLLMKSLAETTPPVTEEATA